MPIIAAAKIKPIKYPPVGPAMTVGPLLNPVKTGAPARPSKMYIITLITAFLAPSTAAAVKTAKVCNETGTPIGMLSHEQTQIIAVNRAVSAMSTVNLLVFFMLATPNDYFYCTIILDFCKQKIYICYFFVNFFINILICICIW